MSFWNEKEAKKLFQMLPSYNVLIEKPKHKGLKKIWIYCMSFHFMIN